MKKNLKRLWQAALAVCLLAAPMAACSDDEENDPVLPGDGQPETPADSLDDAGEAVLDSTEFCCYKGDSRIYGLLYKKVAAGRRAPAVVLSHSSSLTHAAMQGYAKALAEKGMVAYCFDFCGGSKKSLSDGSTDSMTVFTEVDDLNAVLTAVRGLDCVDPDSVYLLGSSQGGLVSALVAEERADELAGMVLFYPAFNLPDLVRQFGDLLSGGGFGSGWGGSWGGWGDMGDLGDMLTMSQLFIDAVRDFDVWSHIGGFGKPVLILHGSADIIVPVSNSEKAVALYPDATLQVIEGANHGFNAANLGSLGSLLGAKADYDPVVLPHVFRFVGRE